MAQTVRISAGYTEKTSENYNSEQYSINLEMDASINGTTTEIEQASERLFNLCRKIVNHQKGVSVDTLLSDLPQSQQPIPQQQPASNFTPPPEYSRNSNSGHQCSEKQVKAIFAIAKSRGMVNGAITSLSNRFGKNHLEELTSQEASSLIKELKQ